LQSKNFPLPALNASLPSYNLPISKTHTNLVFNPTKTFGRPTQQKQGINNQKRNAVYSHNCFIVLPLAAKSTGAATTLEPAHQFFAPPTKWE
jgi:hypothetical protein